MRKLKIKKILVIAVVLSLALPLTAYAQSASPATQMSDVFGDVLRSFSNLLSIILQLLQRVLWPIFLAIGGLLNNDILFGYGMEQRLLEVWVQIRNFVNIIFVVTLLGVALFNVLAIKPDSEFALKTFLPKFAIALIAVNFSYIGMKIVLDVSNVMTYAVFALPSSISEQVATPNFVSCTGTGDARTCDVKQDDASKKVVEKICTAYYGSEAGWNQLQKELNSLTDTERSTLTQELLCSNTGGKYTLSDNGKKFFGRYNSKNVALIMAIQFMNVTRVDEVNTQIINSGAGITPGASDANIKLSGITFQLLFAVVLYIVYGAAYLAIFVVLLVRLVVLWLFIALSPVVVLKFILPQGVMPDSGDIGGKFFKNTFAPVLMGIPLTIGYVILEAFKRGFDVKGDPAGLTTVKIDSVAISDLQSMIIAFAAVAVVWVGVFAAARGTFAEAATEMIKGAVKGLGTKAMEGLKMIPLIPAGPGGKGLSFYQAQGLASAPWEKLRQTYGPQSVAGPKMEVAEIQKITKNLGTTKEEDVKRAIREGLETPAGQREVYRLLEKAKTTPKYKELGGKITSTLGSDYKALQEGKLGLGPRQRIASLIASNEPVGTGTRTTPLGPGATTGGGAPAPGQRTNQNVVAVGEAASLGIINAESSQDLIQISKKYNEADFIADPQQRTEKQASLSKDLEGNNEMKTVNKALGAKDQIGKVKESTVAADAKGTPEVKGLSDDLNKALQAMKTKGVSEADAKVMLGRVLKSKFGDKTKDFVSANPDVAKHVTIE